MIKSILANLMFLIFCVNIICAQNTAQISGFVYDGITNEVLIGVNIVDTTSKFISTTDKNGYFNIIIKTPTSIRISYVGYKSVLLNINQPKDTVIVLKLINSIELKQVEIVSKRVSEFNLEKLSMKSVNNIPFLGGKPDVLKAMQLLPGVSSQNEGSSLLLVRGGDPGQNLYLFDNVPIIYVNHLGGFLSVFNPDIISEISLYKGGFPANYGGKISSIVDIKQRDGDASGYKSSIGIGITDLSISIEGPTKIKNSSFIIVSRKTLIDPFMALISKLSEGNSFIFMYGFHDINGKYTVKLNSKNTISACIYQGDDYINYWSDPKKSLSIGKNRMNNTWGNWMTSINWHKVFSSKLYGNIGISNTKYRLKEKVSYSRKDDIDTNFYSSDFSSSVNCNTLFANFKFSVKNNWTIGFGANTLLNIHKPNTYTSNVNFKMSSYESTSKSIESRLYMENKVLIHKKLELNIGFNLSNYMNLNFNVFSLEPRIKINVLINSNNVINFSYMRVTQYSHLLFSNTSIMNNEIWIPASSSVLPSYSDQISIGWSSSFNKETFLFDCNLFYKTMNQLVTYKEGYTSIKGDDNWMSKIEKNGYGLSKGIEVQLKKVKGLANGFVSYSFSKTTRKYDGINNGKSYDYEYDRPHSLSISSSYKISPNISINLLWIFQTGLPYTPAIGKQLLPSLTPNILGEYFYYEALIYGDRNSGRMKNYHRLDVSLNYEKRTKRGNKAIWTFSIYNLYNRQNPYSYYYNTNSTSEITIPENGLNDDQISLYQISYFPIMPSVSYKVFFDYSTIKNKVKTPIRQKILKWMKYEK